MYYILSKKSNIPGEKWMINKSLKKATYDANL